MSKQIIILVLALLALAACGQQPGSPSSEIIGPEGRLVELNGSAPIGDRAPTLKLEADSAGGTTGCNSYGGSYRLQDGQLTFTEIFATEMACLEPAGIMEQEPAFLQALGQVSGYTLSGDRLELTNAAGETILIFER